MPKDKIENAIKRGVGATDTENYEEIRYEGYGPGGVAIIIQTLTDNRNRTASDIRAAFAKHGGNLGETGSVGFMFAHMGRIVYPCSKTSEETMLEGAIEAGADNCELQGEEYIVTCATEHFAQVRDALEKRFGPPASAQLTWIPVNTVPVTQEETARQLLRLMEALEDHDDVQQVYANFDMPEHLAEKLAA